MKNHDFNLNVVCDSNNKYAVLYRGDSIYQLEAYHRYITRNSKSNYNYENKTNYSSLITTIKRQLPTYNNFIKKWVTEKKGKENVLHVEYYRYVNAPESTIKRILNFFYPGMQFDEDIIKDAIENENILLKHNITDDIHIKIKNELGL